MKVKENELLPVLLEELPHLHISPHALGRMWEQQMQQVDRLHVLSSSHSHHRRSKLSRQVGWPLQATAKMQRDVAGLYSLWADFIDG